MKSNEPIVVEIVSTSDDGCGYSADKKYAVYGALAGETVYATPITRKRKRLYLRTVDVVNPASGRVDPECRVAGYCGGCSFQHLAHSDQLASKTLQLERAFFPLVPETWLPPVHASTYHYRSKARIGVKFVEKKNRVLVGFREKLKPYITDTPSCPVLVEPVSFLIEPLAQLIGGLSAPSRIPQIELASGDDEIALVFRHLEPLTVKDLSLFIEFGRQHHVQMFLQPGGVDTTYKIYPDDGELLLSYRLPDHDLDFRFSPQDFTQVNLAVNRKMVDLAIELLDLQPTDHLLDAFCGIGNFSLAISRFCDQVVGLELSAASIDRARDNARINRVGNVLFQVADLQADIPEIKGLQDVNKVLLDPPRSGAEQLVKVLASSNVSRVVYVSCNPKTLARDVKILVQQGFVLRSAGIIDMFPHTTHIESIALLVRQDRPG
jgi:23S rRNA (uracil1939-C5)-methyltransferase